MVGTRWLQGLWVLGCGIVIASGALANGHSLRFFGTASGDVDRVKIRVDDPATTTAGPPVDVGATDFTIELWLRGLAADNTAPAVACGANANWHAGNVILDRDRAGQPRTFGVALGNGRIVFGVTGDAGSVTLCGTANVLDNAWHHVAVQRRRSDGALSIYVDGALDAAGAGPIGDVSYPDAGVPQNTCGGPCSNDPFLVLGADKRNAGPAFNGFLDELRVSSRLRYASAFARPVAPFAADPYTAALYHFDEGTGTAVHDEGGRRGGPSDGARFVGGASDGPQWTTATPFDFGPLAVTLPAVVANGLGGLTAIDNGGDGSGRLYLARQSGIIHVLRSGASSVVATPFLDISAANGGPVKTTNGSEQGLVGLAFHPAYRSNGFVYVYYTRALPANPADPGSQIVIARYTRSAANPEVADPASGSIVITVDHPGQTNHNGGMLRFGPDGYLYIGTGDGGGGNDPFLAGQNLADRRGKLLRLDVDGVQPYAIPAGNPFAGSTCTPTTQGTCPEILGYGLRNPWRGSFDRLTGDLFIADVGQDTWEEVNLRPSGASGAANFGWSVCEGNHLRGSQANLCTLTGDARPIAEYGHTSFDGTGGNSITGGYRYRGRAVPVLSGRYVFGDFVSGRIWTATVDSAGTWTRTLLTTVSGSTLSTFGEDEAGELYVGDINGALRRVAAIDADTDGLPDGWETAYYGNTSGAATADTDLDGLTSAQEYARGLDPRAFSPSTVRADFTGDGSAEAMWRNASGANLFWTFDAQGQPAASGVQGAPANWTLAALADQNGDSRTDLVWADPATGAVVSWFMNGSALLGTATLAQLGANAGWTLAASGDLDGDGRVDFVWKNADGRVAGWRMGNGAIAQGIAYPAVPAGWEIVGAGDLDLDGKAEIVWRRASDNAYFVWRNADSANVTLEFIAMPGSGWRIALIDDFDGDGAADFLWRDASGANAVWPAGDPSRAVFLPGVDNAWTPVASGRYDGTAAASVLWQRVDGVVARWRFGGDLATPTAQFLPAVPAGWFAVRP